MQQGSYWKVDNRSDTRRNSLPSMETERSLPCWQKSVTER